MWLGLPPPPPLNPNLAEVLKIHCSAHEGWGDISFRARGIKLDVQTRNAIRRSLKVKAKSNQTSSVLIFSYSLKSYFDVRISYAAFVNIFIRIAPVIFCSMPQCWTQTFFSILLRALPSTYYTLERCLEFKSEGIYIDCSIQ